MFYVDSESGFKSFKLTILQEYGVKKAVQYGVHLKLLTSTSEAQENLTKLLRHAGFFLKQQQRQVLYRLNTYTAVVFGCDWVSIFIIQHPIISFCSPNILKKELIVTLKGPG